MPAQDRQVGYMPQGNIVFPHLSVEHNITYSKRGTPDMCNTLLQRLGLEKYRHTKAGRLSGGEQQRVALGVLSTLNRLCCSSMSLYLHSIGT